MYDIFSFRLVAFPTCIISKQCLHIFFFARKLMPAHADHHYVVTWVVELNRKKQLPGTTRQNYREFSNVLPRLCHPLDDFFFAIQTIFFNYPLDNFFAIHFTIWWFPMGYEQPETNSVRHYLTDPIKGKSDRQNPTLVGRPKR